MAGEYDSKSTADSVKALLEVLFSAKSVQYIIVAALAISFVWWVIVQDGCNHLIDTIGRGAVTP